jgi:hypothetical protein
MKAIGWHWKRACTDLYGKHGKEGGRITSALWEHISIRLDDGLAGVALLGVVGCCLLEWHGAFLSSFVASGVDKANTWHACSVINEEFGILFHVDRWTFPRPSSVVHSVQPSALPNQRNSLLSWQYT